MSVGNPISVQPHLNNKRHTRPCAYYQSNSCPLAPEECDFAHVLAAEDPLYPLKAPYSTLRTKTCRFYTAGSCKQGIWCRFKHPVVDTNLMHDHGIGEKRKLSWDEKIQEGVSLYFEGAVDDGSIDVRDINPEWSSRCELHPKYRTRPCRNYFLGRCMYGDACSYLHSAPDTSILGLPASPSSPNWPLTPPSFYPSPPSSESLPYVKFCTDYTVAQNDRDMADAQVNSPAMLSSVPPTSLADEALGPLSVGPMEPLPVLRESVMKYPLPANPYRPFHTQAHPHTQGPMTIVHVPVAVPVFSAQMMGRIAQRRPTRPRSLSQPILGTSAQRSIYYKTKPCKYFNADGKCPKGDRCNFIHGSGTPTNSILACEGEKIEENDEQTECTAVDSIGNQTQVSTTEGKTKENFFKVNWRVLGGGVIIGNNDGNRRRHSLDKVSHGVYRKASVPFDIDSRDVTCAFYPSCPHGDSCSFKHIDPVAHDSDDQLREMEKSKTRPLSITVPPVSRHLNFAPLTGADDGDEMMDWGDEFDSQEAAAVIVVRARSSPSTPVSGYMELPSRFAAESP